MCSLTVAKMCEKSFGWMDRSSQAWKYNIRYELALSLGAEIISSLGVEAVPNYSKDRGLFKDFGAKSGGVDWAMCMYVLVG